MLDRCVRVEGPSVVKDASIGDGARIGAFSHVESATMAPGAGIGPFARLRAGADVATGAYVGNFCEVKNARVGPRTNVCHLSYLGDAELGENVNIGAGTITCNFSARHGSHTLPCDNACVLPHLACRVSCMVRNMLLCQHAEQRQAAVHAIHWLCMHACLRRWHRQEQDDSGLQRVHRLCHDAGGPCGSRRGRAGGGRLRHHRGCALGWPGPWPRAADHEGGPRRCHEGEAARARSP